MPTPETIDVRALPTYLGAASGWRRVKTNDRREIWAHDSGARIFVPRVVGPDFAELMDEAIQRLQTTEGRPSEDVEIDLVYFMFDKLHVRRVGAERGLALNDGLAFHQALHDLVRASALAAREPRPHYAGGQAEEVSAYLDKVRLIPARQGSFVARALLPLDTGSPDESPIPMPVPVADDARAVSTMLLRGAETAVAVAQEITRSGTPALWEDGVADGVSAELCDALARLLGPVNKPDDVDLDITWTWQAPAGPTPRVEVPAGLGPMLRAGQEYLRRAPSPVVATVTGRVTDLHRVPRIGPGEVTVQGYIDKLGSTERPVRLPLDEKTYDRAVGAHRRGRTVEARAEIINHPGRPLEVRRVIRFTVKRDRSASERGELF